ncbi:MAG: lysozyme inhibitor LprI family protein [Granulosicoccus sp.]
MFGKGILGGVVLATIICLAAPDTHAQSTNVLKECVAVSQDTNDTHACMDNYLNLMDNNIAGMTDFLSGTLSGNALAGLARSQSAFAEYRRQNCLWYLEFSSPRSEAELIAKNCLATMSRQRWQELQGLLSEESASAETVSGFYVYGAGKNSFQQCGSEASYWLSGDPSVVNEAQQRYLSLATSELQKLYVVFAGTIDNASNAPEAHRGLFNVNTVIDMSVPSESGCRIPGNLSAFDLASSADIDESALNTVTDDDLDLEQDEPQQQLIAYFGDWLVECTEDKNRKECALSVSLDKIGADKNDPSGSLIIFRGKQRKTSLELRFPDREIDSPTLIRWRVDAFTFGDIVGSSILVDEVAARQIVPDDRFLRTDLLPLMIEGVELSVEVLQNVDDATGEEFHGTLNGLTKALAFSDGFVLDGG